MSPPLRLLAFGLLTVVCLLPGTAIGGLVIYDSIDVGVGPGGAHPNYDAELAQFETATSAFNVITFEGLPLGPFTNPDAPEVASSASIALGQGVVANLTGVDPAPSTGSGITSQTGDQFLGFNVTPGGSEYLRLVPFIESTPADVTFQFSQNVTSFGFAITGLGGSVPGLLQLKFTPVDGTPQDLTITGNIEGGLVFYGVSGFGQASQFTLQMSPTIAGTRDIIGIDDLRWSTAVPEPSAGLLCFIGGAAILALRFVRRSASWLSRRPPLMMIHSW